MHKQVFSNIGALIITYTILGVPYYNYRIMGPKPYSNYFGPYIIGICSQRLGGCYFAAAGTFIGFHSERGRFGLALKGTLRVPASEVDYVDCSVKGSTRVRHRVHPGFYMVSFGVLRLVEVSCNLESSAEADAGRPFRFGLSQY